MDVDGTPQVEAAKQLGLSGSGLRSRVQRGRKQLRQLFLDCCEIEFGKNTGIADWSPRQDANFTYGASGSEAFDTEAPNKKAAPLKTCYPCQ